MAPNSVNIISIFGEEHLLVFGITNLILKITRSESLIFFLFEVAITGAEPHEYHFQADTTEAVAVVAGLGSGLDSR